MRTVIPKDANLIPKNAELVFKGIIYDTYHFKQKMFDGSCKTYEMLKRPDTVLVIAIIDDKIVIINQKQPGHASSYIDIPGGRHDIESETELDAAKRELLEETGLTFTSWKLLDVWQPASHIDRLIYVFLAQDLVAKDKPKLDIGEDISVEYLSLSEVKKLSNNRNARSLPKHIFDKVSNLKELKNLPKYYVN